MRQHLVSLLPILLVYLVLACYGIDNQSFWVDEALSVRDASSATLIWTKAHGPLYFALLHVWMYIGTSDRVLRALSVLLGAMAVCLFYATSRTLLSQRVTVFSTLLFATSPFLIWYSQEVRYITLVLVTILLAMNAFRQLGVQDRLVWWLTYGSAMLLALASFVTTIFMPLVQVIYLVWSPSSRLLLRKWFVCLLLISLPYGWWASGHILDRLFPTKQVEITDSGQQRVFAALEKFSRGGAATEFTPALIPYTFFAFSVGFSQGPSLRELQMSQSLATLRPYMLTLLSHGLLFAALFLAGLVAIWRHPDVGKLLTLWVSVPLMGVLSMTLITNLGYNVRYVAMVFPAYILILAAGIAWFRRPMVQITLLAVVLLSNGLSLANYYSNPQYMRADARTAMRYLESAVRPGDVVVAVGDATALEYYASQNMSLVILIHPDQTQLPVERVRELASNHDRLWFVAIRFWGNNLTEQVEAALDNAYSLVKHQPFPGIDIYLYQPSQ